MSRSIHETTKQLKNEYPTRGDLQKLTYDDPTLTQLRKKRALKKEVIAKRKAEKIEEQK